jgi:spore coat polysaccharide biosynthesis protein SpsF
VLQARLTSTRLPRKLLLPLCGVTILEHILIRLACSAQAGRVVVATTADTAPEIRGITEKHGAGLYVGSEQDVLGRYIDVVRAFDVGNVVRATADNPLVDIEYLDRALILHRSTGADLTAFPLLPYGTGVEVIKGEVLTAIGGLASDPFEREHLTQYLYRHESDFFILRGTPDGPMARPDVRLTVDTPEDYRRMQDIYENLYAGVPIKVAEAVEYLDRREAGQG